jgi:hypothetical protein
LRVLQRPRRLVGDRRHLAVHVEQLALVEAEAFHDVLEGVGMDRLLESLPQQILPAFRVGQVAIDRQHDVVGHQALGGREEAEIALDHAPLVLGQAVARFPQRDVSLHGDLGRHPVIVAAGRDISPTPSLYLSGRSWLTSARQLIIRLSSTETRAPPRSISPRPVAFGAGCRLEDRGMRRRHVVGVRSDQSSMIVLLLRCSLAGFAFGIVDGAGLASAKSVGFDADRHGRRCCSAQ